MTLPRSGAETCEKLTRRQSSSARPRQVDGIAPSRATRAGRNGGGGGNVEMRCIDVGGHCSAAANLRRNPDSVVIPFDTQAYTRQSSIQVIRSCLCQHALSKFWRRRNGLLTAVVEANKRILEATLAGIVAGQRHESWINVGDAHYGHYSGYRPKTVQPV